MQLTLSQIHRALAWIVLAGLVLQFYLAGIALFGAGTFESHRMLGGLLTVPVLLLVGLGLAGRLGRRLIGLSSLLLLLTIVQATLPGLRDSASWIAALHPVVGLSLLGISSAIARTDSTEVQRAYEAENPMRIVTD